MCKYFTFYNEKFLINVINSDDEDDETSWFDYSLHAIDR